MSCQLEELRLTSGAHSNHLGEKPMDQTSINPVATEIVQADRKTYVAPTLTDFGSFAEITQGTFAGVGADSGIYS
jgi:hypothetical protein